MAIKLADVVERSNTVYPVLNAHDKNVLGLYNGAASDAQMALELHYTSLVKTGISTDGTAGNPVQFTSSFSPGNLAAGQVGDDPTIPNLLTRSGGIISVLDSSLLSDAGSVPGTAYSAAYLAQVIQGGGNVDTNRHLVSRFSELVQQFNRYPTVTGAQAVALGDAAGEDFYFAGYSTQQNRIRAITFQELVAGIASQLTTDLVNTGVITDAQGTGSGGVGDVNGDGSVSSADLLEFLTNFGLQDTGFETDYKTLDGAQSVDDIVVGLAPDASAPFEVADLSTWNYGTTVNTAGNAYGWTSVSYPVSAANYVKFNTLNLGTGNSLLTSHWHARRLVIECACTVTFDAPDVIYMVVHVILTDASGNDNTNEVMVVTAGLQDFNGNNNGFFTSDYYGEGATGGGAPIGVPVSWVPVVDFKPEGFTERYPVATNYEGHESALEGGFMMNYQFSSNYNIKDLEVRIHFAGTNGAASVDVEQVRHRIIAL